MEYITSRGFVLPQTVDDFSSRFWFNLWLRKLWPYVELVKGDILYWYELPTGCIVWKSQISEIDRFSYENKTIAKNRLEARFGKFDLSQSYFESAPDHGYCLAWKVIPIQKVDLVKPKQLRFPQQGWLRVDDEIANDWLSQSKSTDDVTLDEIVENGSVVEKIRQFNEAMKEVSPERVRSLVSKTLRRDTKLIEALKELCEFRCQFPGCGIRILQKNCGYYSEVAHIQPVHTGGRSVIGNLLVLCPNHHKEFDYGDLEIDTQTFEEISGKLNGKAFTIKLPGADSVVR